MPNFSGTSTRGMFPRVIDGRKMGLPELAKLCGGASESILRTVIFKHPTLNTSSEVAEAVRRYLATPKKVFHPGRRSRRWNSGLKKPSEQIPDCPQKDQF